MKKKNRLARKVQAYGKAFTSSLARTKSLKNTSFRTKQEKSTFEKY
jgi:hypothetical protein